MLDQPFDVREPGLLTRERRALARLGADPFDLPHLVGEQVEFALAVASGLAQPVVLVRGLAEGVERLTVGGQRHEVFVAGEPVEERRLGHRRQQALGLMLTVDLDEVFAERGQRGRRGQLAGDARRALALGRDGPGQDDLAVLGPVVRVVGSIEPGLDPGSLGSVAHQRGSGTRPEREREPGGHHGLAGTGLSGEDVQAGVQRQVEIVDDAQPRDMELVQHARILAR